MDPTSPAVGAARRIHLSLLAALRRNEDGARRDLDAKFLHDFRVAVRRTRSALSQIKGVFHPAARKHFQAEFAWLGGLTGATRDLDVYLLKLDEYRDALSPEIRRGLRPFAKLLRGEQRREQRKMAAALGSGRYRRLLIEWQGFLEEGELPPGILAEAEPPPEARRPVGEVAAVRIWKAYRRVIRRGTAIREKGSAEALHEVRIQCKKLRYLMEFFKDFYPPTQITGLIKVLKRLQDNLGRFNDYEVQQKGLAGFAHRLLETGDASAATVLAMGRLQARMAEGQAKERRRFAKVFAHFATRQHQERFRALFRVGHARG